jgi:DNA polymerase elongation subunit (family B)
VEHVLDSRNFKLKKQVEVTTALTKELDSTTEELEFCQEKYEEAMKIVRKIKNHYPQDVEMLSDEETKEFTAASPPCKMATHAPLVYVIPNIDDD